MSIRGKRKQKVIALDCFDEDEDDKVCVWWMKVKEESGCSGGIYAVAAMLSLSTGCLNADS